MAVELSPLMESAAQDTTRRLVGQFRDVFSEETVAQVVRDSFEQLAGPSRAGVNFLPVLGERFARERLQAAAQAEGLVPKALPELLFICVHNAGRSQMAAALAHELSNGTVSVRSAGSDPTEKIHPVVVEAMAEIGIDVKMEFPKPLTDEVVRAADAVITMGCGDACPVYPGKHYENWELADPSEQPLDGVRAIRDEIRAHVEQLIATVTTEPAARAGDDVVWEPASAASAAGSSGSSSRWKRAFGRSM